MDQLTYSKADKVCKSTPKIFLLFNIYSSLIYFFKDESISTGSENNSDFEYVNFFNSNIYSTGIRSKSGAHDFFLKEQWHKYLQE